MDGVIVKGHPFDPPNTKIDLRLRPDSPCLGSGSFLTTVTSPAGAGKSLAVADPLFFCDGYGLVPGDEIQLQGSPARARVLHADYRAKVLTLDAPLTWKTGQGIALAYEGPAPNFGAFGTP